jgi:hypothetical protein
MNRTATKAIVIHTTAGNSGNSPEDIQSYFLNILRLGKGGYHFIVDQQGRGKDFYDWRLEATNGILPSPQRDLSNANTIHLSYIGGINNYNANQAVCNISKAQEKAFYEKIQDILEWYPNVVILGHNQINPKWCPSFWVPDWLLRMGISGKHIDDRDPFNLKEQVKKLVHPPNFYEIRQPTVCPTCGK